MIFQDRAYQTKAFDDVRTAFAAGNKRVLLVMPCGSGKTVVFGRISQSAIGRGLSVAILAHRRELIMQASNKLTGFDVPHGIIKADIEPDYSQPVQVGSVQTLVNCLDEIKPPNLIIPDEAHHSQNHTQQAIITRYGAAKLLGVTASPIFGTGQTMGGYYDVIVMGPTVRELVEDGYLTRTLVFAPPPVAELEDDDYSSIEKLEYKMNRRHITGDAIEHYTRLAAGMSAIAFCTTIKHCEDVAEMFRAAGYSFYAIDGTMHKNVRDKLIEDFNSGTIQGLCSCDLIGEGTDVPGCRVAIKLAPTKRLQKHIQNDGRNSRPVYAAGFDLNTRDGRLQAIATGPKPYSVCIDHVNNLFFHGMPDDEFQWSLTEQPIITRNGEPLLPIQQCPNCWLHHAPAPVCPYCGTERPVQERKLVYTKGQLVQIKSNDKATLKQMKADVKAAKTAKKKADEEIAERKRKELKLCKTHDDFYKYAVRHKFEDPKAWAGVKSRIRHQYIQKFKKKGN